MRMHIRQLTRCRKSSTSGSGFCRERRLVRHADGYRFLWGWRGRGCFTERRKLRHLHSRLRVPDMQGDHQCQCSSHGRDWKPCNAPVPEPSSGLRCGPGCRKSGRSHCIGGCLLCQENYLPAAAAPGEMSEKLLALLRAKRLLGEGVEAFDVGMKIELGSCIHVAAFSWNASGKEICSIFFRFRFRSRGSAPSAS